ncbi:MAG: class II fructose-bisphosphatase [Negativicutes bacterium]|nr:class II fructose-bisphosphatase [Negativicutes bacterium]
MHRELTLEFVRVTEAAALACGRLLGRGDKNGADGLAVEAMRRLFDSINIEGTVVIGEGEMDEAPMLFIGEKVGNGQGPQVDIAVDPLEGTNLVAKGLPGAISCLAAAPAGCLLHAPDMYMEKIAVGPAAAGLIDINWPVSKNLEAVAKAKQKSISEVTLICLDRERHSEIIRQAREAGARIRLITDGDVSAAVSTAIEDSGIDIMIGTGGAPEGVLAAAALKCMGGELQGRLIPMNETEKTRVLAMGLQLGKVLRLNDLVKTDDVFFSSTGISDGDLLKGVRYSGNGIAKTQSIVMRGRSGTVRIIEATHRLAQKQWNF